MNFDLAELGPRTTYKLLTGLVVPRPIALVTTLDENGLVNAAPFSFFNCMGTDPPLIVFQPGPTSPHTPANIRANGEFVVNFVTEEMAQAMNICAVNFPEGVSEIEMSGLATEPSHRVLVPRIAQSPASLECREHSIVEVGRNRLVIGIVEHVHVRDGIVDENFHVKHEKLLLLGRLAGSGYCRTADTFDMPRLNLEQWQNRQR